MNTLQVTHGSEKVLEPIKLQKQFRKFRQDVATQDKSIEDATEGDTNCCEGEGDALW